MVFETPNTSDVFFFEKIIQDPFSSPHSAASTRLRRLPALLPRASADGASAAAAAMSVAACVFMPASMHGKVHGVQNVAIR